MGFYDNSNVQHKKVVHISNETANIDGLTVEKNLHVDCPATFNDEVNFLGFVWKKESFRNFVRDRPSGCFCVSIA